MMVIYVSDAPIEYPLCLACLADIGISANIVPFMFALHDGH